jgi:hypothetical protein
VAGTISNPRFGVHALLADENLRKLPEFTRRYEGHIALQHASVSPLKAPVWFRQIRIRELPEPVR